MDVILRAFLNCESGNRPRVPWVLTQNQITSPKDPAEEQSILEVDVSLRNLVSLAD